MKKKYLIVVADYYKDIADGLISSALKVIPKKNIIKIIKVPGAFEIPCLLYTSPSPRDYAASRMPSSA